MNVEARASRKPSTGLRMLVRRIVVDDEVRVETRRNRGIDVLQEAQKLLVAMTLPTLRDHLTIGDVESGEQGRRPVPDLVVGYALSVSQPQWQDRLRSFERLDLGLLVDAQHDGIVGRVEVEAEDIANLVDEGRVGGKLEALRTMRLYAEEGEHAGDCRLGEAGLGGGGANRPVRAFRRLLLQNGVPESTEKRSQPPLKIRLPGFLHGRPSVTPTTHESERVNDNETAGV